MGAEALRVILYAGPGTGKSTTAALVFGRLKQAGRNVELVHEYAKDLTWEHHYDKLKFQPYVAAKQMWWMERLEGKVDAVITDTSTLYGLIYGDRTVPWWPPFADWLVEEYNSHPTLSFFLHRDPSRAYNPAGRRQSEDSAKAVDSQIRDMLICYDIPCIDVQVSKDDNAHVDEIVARIEEELDARA